MPERTKQPKMKYTLKLNKEIAYKGAVGQKREAFCIDYIQKKKKIFAEFLTNQVETTLSHGEIISCHKGCFLCCHAYMQASVQECEVIVHYLYHNEEALATFVKNYMKWRKQLRQKGDIFQECGQAWQKATSIGFNGMAQQALRDSETKYQEQNIYCPFLVDNSCMIYDVRPFTCAALISTSPGEYCSLSNENIAKTYVTQNPIIFDTSFYHNKINGTVLVFMPLFVYNVVKYGYKMLSSIPGLEDVEKTVLKDAEVIKIIDEEVR
jgi:hypothetical protein